MCLGLAGLCAAVLSLAAIYLYLDPQIPAPETYRDVQLETPLRIYAENGELLAEFGERRLIPITIADVPQHFINALLDTEDKRFYEHSGIDFISLSNDVLSLVGTFVSEGELGGGASTITMQLARNVSFSLERRFLRKFKEMLLALKIEQELTKDEILELYINLVPFGKRAYGAQAAALTYYGKPLDKLSLAQLAMLAGIPQAPSAGNPINGPKRALARRNLVLSRMLAQTSISQEEYDIAKSTAINAAVYARDLDIPSPYAAEWVRQQASTILPDLYTGGYEIRTTINGPMQAEATAALRRGLIGYDQKHGYRGAEAQVDADLLRRIQESAHLLPLASAIASAANTSERDETGSSFSSLSENSSQYDATLVQELDDYLDDFSVYGGLEVAAILAVDESSAWAQRSNGERVLINKTDSTWAREYIHVDRRGPPVAKMSDVVAIGDIIRLRRQDDEGIPGRWLLAQLPEIQGAVVSLDPQNGAVKALVGGFDFYRNQYNHALQAARQPGSGFKPFVYSAAIESGVTPADIFMDAPLVFDDENLESQYRPDNDNNRYNGPTRLREALYRSINLVSMRVLLRVGAGQVMDHVANFGFDTRNFPRNTQLAIGGGTMAVTPITMARAYAVLANGGYLVDPHIITSIKDTSGEELMRANHPFVCEECGKQATDDSLELPLEDEPASLAALLASTETTTNLEPEGDALDIPGMDTTVEGSAAHDLTSNHLDGTSTDLGPPPPMAAPRVVDERNIFIMNSMLRDVIKRGTGRAARRLRRNDLAGKTGTTNEAADTWFNGYSPALATTVWVGFSDHAPLGARAYGSNTPLPIWIDFMEDALADIAEIYPPQPTDVITMKIDPKTGEPARPGQPNAVFEFFLREHAPTARRSIDVPNTQTEEPVKAIDIF